MIREPLSKDDWAEWLSLQQTQEHFKAIKVEQDDMLQFALKRTDLDALAQARLLGIMSGLQKVLDFDYTDGSR